MVYVPMNGRKKAPRMVANGAEGGAEASSPDLGRSLSTFDNPVPPLPRRPLVPIFPAPREFVVRGEYEESTGKAADNLDGKAD